MNKRGAGVIFCAISAFLFFSKYFFKIAIYIVENGNFMIGFDRSFLAIRSTVITFNILSIIALIIGVIYLIAGEKEEKQQK